MSVPDAASREGRARRRVNTAAGLAFFIAGLILVLSLVMFRSGRQVEWPPSSASLWFVAFAAAGTAFAVALLALIALALALVDALRGLLPWRLLGVQVLGVLAVAALLAASAAVSIRVFYRPWAHENALRTALSNPEKWRLLVSADVISRQLDERTEQTLKAGSARTGGAGAAAAYVLAAAGREEYLHGLTAAGLALPARRPDGVAASKENDIAAQEDVLWLLKRLAGASAASPRRVPAHAGQPPCGVRV